MIAGERIERGDVVVIGKDGKAYKYTESLSGSFNVNFNPSAKYYAETFQMNHDPVPMELHTGSDVVFKFAGEPFDFSIDERGVTVSFMVPKVEMVRIEMPNTKQFNNVLFKMFER